MRLLCICILTAISFFVAQSLSRPATLASSAPLLPVQGDAKAKLDQGRKLLKLGKADQALGLLEQALK